MALINRERLALPKIEKNPNMVADEDYIRSKSLPTKIVKGFGCDDASYEFKEALGIEYVLIIVYL